MIIQATHLGKFNEKWIALKQGDTVKNPFKLTMLDIDLNTFFSKINAVLEYDSHFY